MHVHVQERSVELLAADVVVVDVNTLRGEALQRVVGRLLLVVPSSVETELLGDVLQLGIVANTADDRQALVLGQLAHQRADGTSGRGDEDGLALLGLADLKKTGVGRQSGHAQSADEHVQAEIVWVLQHLEAPPI